MGKSVANLLKKNGAVSVCLASLLFVILSLTSPFFLQTVNFESIQTSIAPYGIVAIGMMALLVSGVFDLSVGSVMCLGGLVTAICLTQGMHPVAAIAVGLLSGAAVGFINGLLVEIVGVNALITTIGMMYIARGVCEVVLVGKGKAGFTDFPESFQQLGRGQFLGVYYMFWIMLVLMVLFQLYMVYAPSGRRLYFVGGNPAASRQLAINKVKIRILTFVLSGTLAALSGILITARAGIANRYTGVNAHMDIIIACIIGGGSLAGGQGSVVGAFFGITFMVFMSNAFNLFTIAPQWQSIIVGIILLVVIAVDGYVSLARQKKLGKI